MTKEDAIEDIKQIMVEQRNNFGINRPNPFLSNTTIGDHKIRYNITSEKILVYTGGIGLGIILISEKEYLGLLTFYKNLDMTDPDAPSKEYLQNNLVTVVEIGNQKPELYIGCKIIKATPMNRTQFDTTVQDVKTIEKLTKEKSEPGYLVEYSDGYKSWSPKAVFENAYRKITESEFKLLNS